PVAVVTGEVCGQAYLRCRGRRGLSCGRRRLSCGRRLLRDGGNQLLLEPCRLGAAPANQAVEHLPIGTHVLQEYAARLDPIAGAHRFAESRLHPGGARVEGQRGQSPALSRRQRYAESIDLRLRTLKLDHEPLLGFAFAVDRLLRAQCARTVADGILTIVPKGLGRAPL